MEHHTLQQFGTAEYVSKMPLLKDLQNHITPHYAIHWRVIGTQLGLSSGMLDIIEYDNHDKAEACCNAVFDKWLEVDQSASWNELLNVIQLPAVCRNQATEKGVETVFELSKRVGMMNVHLQDRIDDNEWPPGQPQEYTPLVLIQHQEQRTKHQDCEMAKLIQTGEIDSVIDHLAPKRQKLDSHETIQHILSTSIVTKRVSEILVPLEESSKQKFVLIEGAPGIGKSFLLKHIASQWGKKCLLFTLKIVFLICLRDPRFWKAESILSLLEIFCKGDASETANSIATTCSNYFIRNGGKDIAFLLDGYDELPEHVKEKSLITDIINRTTLPLCSLVVSSRPHTSASLRKKAAVRVEILGLGEQERQHYITQSVKGNPQKIKELTHYLNHHPTISDICFSPLNMTILLFLYHLGVPLPNSSTELYHHFICQTVYRYLLKSGCPLKNNITNLAALPVPYNEIVKQLAKLSLDALSNNKLVFTVDDIKHVCPDIINSPETININGFGLLQAVQHFDFTGKTVTFNFLHLSIQEYLAAYYIVNYLPQDQEFHFLCEKFWSNLHANMFFIYVALTKGQRASFKKFLSGGDDKIAISSEFLLDQLKCFHLYRCFKEAGDDTMCKSIEDAAIFSKQEILLSYTSLSATDIECVSLFLTSSSNKQWLWLDLLRCFIQDHGLHIVHKYLNHNNIKITNLSLSHNSLTRSSSSFISDIVISCQVERLWISDNYTIGEDKVLYTMLTHPSSLLTDLYMAHTSLSCIAAKALFTAVKDAKKLKLINIIHTAIADDVADDITKALTVNKSLETLWMYGNPISGEATVTMLQALKGNNTLQTLYFPTYPPAITNKIRLIEQEINIKRKSQGIKQMLMVNLLSW